MSCLSWLHLFPRIQNIVKTWLWEYSPLCRWKIIFWLHINARWRRCVCCLRRVCFMHTYNLTVTNFESLSWNFTRYGHCFHHDQSHCQMKRHDIPWSPVILWWNESQPVCACLYMCVCECVAKREKEKRKEGEDEVSSYTSAMICACFGNQFHRLLLNTLL